jgi:hypothetical protein
LASMRPLSVDTIPPAANSPDFQALAIGGHDLNGCFEGLPMRISRQ